MNNCSYANCHVTLSLKKKANFPFAAEICSKESEGSHQETALPHYALLGLGLLQEPATDERSLKTMNAHMQL